MVCLGKRLVGIDVVQCTGLASGWGQVGRCDEWKSGTCTREVVSLLCLVFAASHPSLPPSQVIDSYYCCVKGKDTRAISWRPELYCSKAERQLKFIRLNSLLPALTPFIFLHS